MRSFAMNSWLASVPQLPVPTPAMPACATRSRAPPTMPLRGSSARATAGRPALRSAGPRMPLTRFPASDASVAPGGRPACHGHDPRASSRRTARHLTFDQCTTKREGGHHGRVQSDRRSPISRSSLRLRLQVLFAKAFESLADTYRLQAVDFVRRLAGRMTVEEALRALLPRGRRAARDGADGPGPGADRARADRPTTSRSRIPARAAAGRSSGPTSCSMRCAAGSQTQEETSLDCRMAASVSDEAIAATHVAMALETVAPAGGRSQRGRRHHALRALLQPSLDRGPDHLPPHARGLGGAAPRVRGPSATVCATPSLPFTPRVPLTCASPAERRGRSRSDSAG